MLLCNLVSYAQNRNLQLETERFTYYVDRFTDVNVEYLYDVSYKGTPYYKEEFQLGKIYLDKELLDGKVALRFNAFTDEIEFKESIYSSQSDIKALVKSEDIYVLIEKELFVFRKNIGYLKVLFDGTNYSLLKKITKKYYPYKKATTSLTKDAPAEFQDRFKYFLATKTGDIIELPKSKNKLLKLLTKYDSNIKNYTKKKNLDTTKEDDLKKIISYLDNLKN